jgi:hypothetical protein
VLRGLRFQDHRDIYKYEHKFIGTPFFEVTELSGGNLLNNADGGRGGVGAVMTPQVGDGVLSPGESMTVTFVVGLTSRNPFRFVLNVGANQSDDGVPARASVALQPTPLAAAAWAT